jgi:arabinose-5-phosphate isomerase
MHQEKLKGIITDGDLRRSMLKGIESLDHAVDEFMTINPATISEEAMFADAEQTMIERKIKALIAVNNENKVSGIVEIFD